MKLIDYYLPKYRRKKPKKKPTKPKKRHLSYSEMLRTKQWDKLRTRILTRDNYCCRVCSNTEHLHVHHIFYVGYRDAWKYPDFVFMTLCEHCHKEWHSLNPSIRISKTQYREILSSPNKDVAIAKFVTKCN